MEPAPGDDAITPGGHGSGWVTGTRTPVVRFKAEGPTIRRLPNCIGTVGSLPTPAALIRRTDTPIRDVVVMAVAGDAEAVSGA